MFINTRKNKIKFLIIMIKNILSHFFLKYLLKNVLVLKLKMNFLYLFYYLLS